jgi:PEP-CTERM motif
MRRSKQLCLLAAVDALAIGGFGAFTQTAHAAESPDVLALNIVASGGQWSVYLDDKAGDPGVSNTDGNIGVGSFTISVVGSGGITVNAAGNDGSSEDAPSNSYSYKVGTKTCQGSSGFSLESSNGVGSTTPSNADGTGDGVILFAVDQTAQTNSTAFAYTGFGISNGSDATVPSTHASISGYSAGSGGVSWTQTSLGVLIASGGYGGTAGKLSVFGDGAANSPSPDPDNTTAVTVLPSTWTAGNATPYATLTPSTAVIGVVTSSSSAVAVVAISNSLAAMGSYGAVLTTPIGSNGGSNGTYVGITRSWTPTSTGYLDVNGYFNPSKDNEAYFFDVTVNGTQATDTQLASVIGLINGTAGFNATVAYDADGTIPLVDPFPSKYNLLLYFSTAELTSLGVGDDLYLGLNLSSLSGFQTTGVGVVPEPATLGLLALGSLGVFGMGRRRRN